MSPLELAAASLLSPAILAFFLGVLAGVLGSDLRVPEAIQASISIYLLFAIGLKGGAALRGVAFADLVLPALAAVVLGSAIPVWTYVASRRLGGLGVADAAALAAHYGSTSAVTFIAALEVLRAGGEPSEPFMIAVLALLEMPAIAIALLLARSRLAPDAPIGTALREVLGGKSVVLLAGGMAIGWASGPAGLEKVASFFVAPFLGVLVLFLLELGAVVALRLREAREAGRFVLLLAVTAPFVHGAIGTALGTAAGLSVGGATLLGVLAGSASYIAAPAAVRLALPQANPGVYLGASLGITFPLNLVLGIPFDYAVARLLAAA